MFRDHLQIKFHWVLRVFESNIERKACQKKSRIQTGVIWNRFFKSLAVFILLFAIISGCRTRSGSREAIRSWMAENGKKKILCTTAQIGDLTSEIGGDRLEARVLIQGTLDPHSYELVKGDDEVLQRADLIFYNGLGLEHGASLSEWLRGSQKAVSVGDRIRLSSPERILYKGSSIDPHVWMDISLWSQGALPIAERLSEIDPEGREFYLGRAAAVVEKMREAHFELKEKLRAVPAKSRYLVTSHDAFQYFTRSYLAEAEEKDWRSRFAAPEGLAPDGQLSSVDIQRIIDYIRLHRIRVIFPETNVSRDSIRKIVSAGRETGLAVRICEEPLYGDAMDGENLHYLEMMRHNADVIATHLSEGEL